MNLKKLAGITCLLALAWSPSPGLAAVARRAACNSDDLVADCRGDGFGPRR